MGSLHSVGARLTEELDNGGRLAAYTEVVYMDPLLPEVLCFYPVPELGQIVRAAGWLFAGEQK